jgi:hypothetical protein
MKKVKVDMVKRWCAGQILMHLSPGFSQTHHMLFRVQSPAYMKAGLTPKELELVKQMVTDISDLHNRMRALGDRLNRTTTYTPNAS